MNDDKMKQHFDDFKSVIHNCSVEFIWHYPKKKDSYKTMSLNELIPMSDVKWEKFLQTNSQHDLIDHINLCLMIGWHLEHSKGGKQ